MLTRSQTRVKDLAKEPESFQEKIEKISKEAELASDDTLIPLERPVLCDTCQRMVTSGKFGYGTHHSSITSFRAAVDEGCFICTVWNDYVDMADEASYPEANYLWEDSKGCTELIIFCSKEGKHTIFDLYSSGSFPSVQKLTVRTNASSNSPLFRAWMEECSTKHHKCGLSNQIKDHRNASGNNWNPTRLLDLDNEDPDGWRLFIPAEDFSMSKYCTMSYRWGGAEFLKLTSATLESFKEGRPLSDLPTAFQDAVAVTRSLGIRYLWIDALCILQGNTEDFSHEIAEMSKIYTHSACNIIAGFGENPYTSIFSHRDFTQIVSSGKIKNLRPGTIWHGFSWDAILWKDSVRSDFEGSPLKTSGWCLQEFVLAPRALFFGRNEVHWSCSCLEASQLWPAGYSFVMSLGLREESVFGSDGLTSIPAWYDLVSRYSCLDLTVAEDKLVALSGLAKEFQQQIEPIHDSALEYYAGHWSRDLELSLCWHIDDASNEISDWEGSTRLSSAFIAPSWSWASTSHRVEFPFVSRGTNISLCEITDVHVSTIGNDPMGRPTVAHLSLKAPSIQLKVHDLKEREEQCSGSIGRFTINWDHGEPPENTTIELVILLWRDPGWSSTSFCGLVLHEKDDESYIRIGYFLGVREGVPNLTDFGVVLRKDKSKPTNFRYEIERMERRTFKIV